jgi:hypothetical protein
LIRIHFDFIYLLSIFFIAFINKINQEKDGDWGLGIGDWGLGPIPNPQSPIPNPQSPIPIFFFYLLHTNLYK